MERLRPGDAGRSAHTRVSRALCSSSTPLPLGDHVLASSRVLFSQMRPAKEAHGGDLDRPEEAGNGSVQTPAGPTRAGTGLNRSLCARLSMKLLPFWGCPCKREPPSVCVCVCWLGRHAVGFASASLALTPICLAAWLVPLLPLVPLSLCPSLVRVCSRFVLGVRFEF